MLATVLTSGFFTRPTQAEFLNTVTQSVGCMLNIGTCPAPTNTTVPGNDPETGSDPGSTTNPSNPDQAPSDDTTPPSVAISADPTLAGGTTQAINITGTALDDNLASYSLAINGNVAQTESNMTTPSASINIPWSVSAPNLVPSGTYLITLDAIDTAGNTAHTEITVEVDNTPPDVTVDGGDVILKSGSISPITSADDTHGIASYTWTADVNNPAHLTFDASAAEPTFTPNIEGMYAFYVAVADGLGNVTNKEFDFSYAQELAPIPLPTTRNPTDALVGQSPSTPAVTPASANPTIRSGRDEITTSDDAGVLGNTITALGQTPPTTNIATIAPTKSGWNIFGLLWYWWLVIIGAFFAGWLLLKKFVLSRIPVHS